MLKRVLDKLWGRGEFAITIPPMDGALRPNTALDEAPVELEQSGVDDCAHWDGELVFSCGAALLGRDGQERHRFDETVLALCALNGGGIAAALSGGSIICLGGPQDGLSLSLPKEAQHVTALTQLDDDSICVAIGSEINAPDHWQRDLLEKRRSGALWRISLKGAAPERLAKGLGWAAGVLKLGDAILVSDAWNAQILSIPLAGGAPRRFVDHLPAYPGRLSADGQGGLWACMFAPRRQLLEFVLREDAYRANMLKSIPEAHWIAPSLRNGQSFLEPLQQGGVKQLGVLKPWAPSFSYGLLVRIDAQGRPTRSLHSRADGHRHGVTSCTLDNNELVFVARGDGVCARVGDLS